MSHTYDCPPIEEFRDEDTNREEAIKNSRCIDPPYGCGKPAARFRNDELEREYYISGLCPRCQVRVFG